MEIITYVVLIVYGLLFIRLELKFYKLKEDVVEFRVAVARIEGKLTAIDEKITHLMDNRNSVR